MIGKERRADNDDQSAGACRTRAARDNIEITLKEELQESGQKAGEAILQ